MNATQFFTSEPVKVQLKFPEPPKQKLKENLTLNYQLITFLTQDVIPSVQQLQDDFVLPKNKVYNHLIKLSDDDSNNMYNIYCEAAKKDEYAKDYEYTTDYFKKLAENLFSEYQKKSDSFLPKLIYTIICYEFILNNAPSIAIANHQLPNYKALKLISEEMEGIKKVFNSRFSKVSNQKFAHGKYKSLFEKIKNSTHKEFIQLTNNI